MGYVVFQDAKRQLEQRLRIQSTHTFEWATLQWRVVDEGDEFLSDRAKRALTDALDAYQFFGIEIADLVPNEIAEWYRALRRN
jgi:hypothetical protein